MEVTRASQIFADFIIFLDTNNNQLQAIPTGKRATLDPSTTIMGADRKGITNYNLRFMSGIFAILQLFQSHCTGLSGTYTLTFQAEMDTKTGVKVKSDSFTLLNRILNANLTNANSMTFTAKV